MITELMKEQEDLIPVYLKKWLDVGYRTTTTNQKKCKKAIDFLYVDILEMEKPSEYIFLRSPMECQVEINKRAGNVKNEYYYESRGNWWNNWYWHYDFILNELLPNEKEGLVEYSKYLDFSKEFHKIYMFDNIVFISDFPESILINSDDDLHSVDSESIKYRDGYSLYSLNGITVPKEIALIKPEDITRDDILKQTNADYRRELIRKLSATQLIEILDPKIIDSNYGYELLSLDLGDNRSRPFLKMNNPSIDAIHIEGVLPTCRTVMDSIKFRNTLEEFELPETLDGFNLFSLPSGGGYHQQGDLLLFPEAIPSHAAVCNHNIAGDGLIRHILINGEIHELNGVRYLLAFDNCEIAHPEHKSTFLEIGCSYRVAKTMEYDHFLNESREVID